jgi:xanthine dehydrogenase large subunit
MAAVGKSIPHDSAVGHVTGEALYLDDVAPMRGELLVDFLGSPVAHGKLLGANYEELLGLPGVVALYTAEDLPGHHQFGPILADEDFLAEGRVQYIGQPIAIVAAEHPRALSEAKKRVRWEIEPLESVLTIEQALARKDFIGPTRSIERGDFEAAWSAAEHRLEGTFFCNGQEQFYLESQAALAYPGEGGELLVHSSTQNPTEIQQVVAEALGLGFHEVVCTCKRMGGGFGGKETQAAIPAVMAALVAYRTRRPARIAWTKDDDMITTGKRHPYRIDYRTTFTAEGRITGLDFDIYSNGGATADLSTSIMERTLLHSENAYYVPNVRFRGTVCRTNLPPNTAFRGFGGPQGMANVENVVQEIAISLGKDAYDIRRLNLYGHDERNVAPYGQLVQNHVLPEVLDQLLETSNYRQRLADIEAFNRTSSTELRGLALTPVKFGISFTTKFLNQGNALVNIYKDGSVQVSTGGTEMGQGLNTKIRQLVADELGVSYEHIRVMTTSTEKNNNASPTAASAGTDLNGMAAVEACRKIRERLAPLAAGQLENPEVGITADASFIHFAHDQVWDERLPETRMPFPDLVKQAYMERISLGERGFYRTPGVDFNRETGSGYPFFYYTTGAAVAEVSIDRFTGNLALQRADLLMDIGESINPGIDRGQVIGGFIQGVGWVTNEELRYSSEGALLSHSPTTYKIPNIQDLPEMLQVDFIHNPNHQINVRRSKAIGEPPLMLCISVWMAVKHALSCVRPGVIPRLNLPATGEEILKRLSELEGFPAFQTPEAEIPLVGVSTPAPPASSIAA